MGENIKLINPGPATSIEMKSTVFSCIIFFISSANLTGDCFVFFPRTKATLVERSNLISKGGVSIITPFISMSESIFKILKFVVIKFFIFFRYVSKIFILENCKD